MIAIICGNIVCDDPKPHNDFQFIIGDKVEQTFQCPISFLSTSFIKLFHFSLLFSFGPISVILSRSSAMSITRSKYIGSMISRSKTMWNFLLEPPE